MIRTIAIAGLLTVLTVATATAKEIEIKFGNIKVTTAPKIQERTQVLGLFKLGQSYQGALFVARPDFDESNNLQQFADNLVDRNVDQNGQQVLMWTEKFVSHLEFNDRKDKNFFSAISLNFTSPSSGNRLFSIERRFSYYDDAALPAISDLRAAYEKKWGSLIEIGQGKQSKFLLNLDAKGEELKQTDCVSNLKGWSYPMPSYSWELLSSVKETQEFPKCAASAYVVVRDISQDGKVKEFVETVVDYNLLVAGLNYDAKLFITAFERHKEEQRSVKPVVGTAPKL
jgi:hypothetical protein